MEALTEQQWVVLKEQHSRHNGKDRMPQLQDLRNQGVRSTVHTKADRPLFRYINHL